MFSSIGCWRRSARFTAALRNVATESVADTSRTLSTPAEAEGNATAAISPMMATTTIISISVTPLLGFPTEDIGIQSFAAGLAVAAVTDDVRLVAMFARKLVSIIVAPGVFRNIHGHVGAVPLVDFPGLHAQRDQPLLGGGERAGIQLVGAQPRPELL